MYQFLSAASVLNPSVSVEIDEVSDICFCVHVDFLEGIRSFAVFFHHFSLVPPDIVFSPVAVTCPRGTLVCFRWVLLCRVFCYTCTSGPCHGSLGVSTWRKIRLTVTLRLSFDAESLVLVLGSRVFFVVVGSTFFFVSPLGV